MPVPPDIEIYMEMSCYQLGCCDFEKFLKFGTSAAIELFLGNTTHWSRVSGLRIDHLSRPEVGWARECTATLLCLHRNKYCVEQLTSPHDSCQISHSNVMATCLLPPAEDQGKQGPGIQQLLLQFSGRGGGWTHTQTHTHTHIHTHTHTHTTEHILVSAVLGQFSSVLYPQQNDHKAVCET